MNEWQEVAYRFGPSGSVRVEISNLRRLIWLHLKRNRCEAFDVFHKTYPLDSGDGQAIMRALRTAK